MDCLSTSSSFFHPSSNPLKSAFMICPASSSIKASTPLRPSASIVAKLQETTAAKCSLRPFVGRKMPLEPPSATTEVMDNTTFDSDVSQKKVLVPIGYGTEEMEAVIVVDVLRSAGADVTVASVEPQLEVEASGGIRLVADTSIASCSTEIFDLIALPGGMPGSIRLRDCQILQKIMSEQAEEKRLYGAICAAPAVTLLPWGLLRKKNSTCHPAFMDKLPSFRAVKANVQVSGELTTSRGPGTAFEFASSLVEQLFGEPEAIEIRDSVLLSTTEYDSRKEEFNKAEWAVGHTPNVLIPVGSSSEPAEVVSIVDILRRAKAHVVVASIEESLQIFSSRGIKTVADQSLSMAADSTYDLIILPGEVTGSAQLSKSKLLKRLLKEQGSAGRIYGAIGSSPVLLQKQGLLMDKKATAHPSVIKKLEGERVDGAKVVIDGKLITSKGLSTVTDFALAIVGKLFGHARARSVAEGLVFEYPRS